VSKGFVTGFDHYYNDIPSGTETKPCFTKQSALATSYNTKEEAEAGVARFMEYPTNKIGEAETLIADINNAIKVWSTISHDERRKFLMEKQIPVYAGKTTDWRGGEQDKYLNLYSSLYNKKDLSAGEIVAIDNMNFDKTLAQERRKLEFYQSQLDFMKTKLVVRQQDLELKFKDSEKRKLKWEVRGDNDTARGYCNCCGGAIPSIPQLRIGYQIRICAICMGKLAQEALIQAGKIDQDILEQYDCDRFLRGV